jgi:hypothetical protein
MLPVPEASLPAVGDLLGEVRRRVDEMRVLHAEVREEGHLQVPVGVRIGVHDLRDGIDELDDELGHRVPRGGLAGEQEGARRGVEPQTLLQALIEGDDVQDVQMLALVLVDALHLDVEEPVGVDLDAGRRGHVGCEAFLAPALHLPPAAPEGPLLSWSAKPRSAR